MNIPDGAKADFCIEIDFQKGSESPSRVFRTMSDLIEAFQALDEDLVRSIDAKIEPVVVIEDIEAGSLRTWLAYVLRSIDDEALKKLDWKPAVGKYLINAKYIVLNFFEGKTQISNREQVENLEKGLLKLAEETDITHFPSYVPVQRPKLLSGIEKITSALSHLSKDDKAIYISAENKIQMNAEFKIVPEDLEELLTQEMLTSESEMILKVKKPDYLGESQWELRHGTHPIFAKILDVEWLKDFQARKQDVRPGDSIRARVETQLKYGYDKELLATHYFINKVIEVIAVNAPDQLHLLSSDNGE